LATLLNANARAVAMVELTAVGQAAPHLLALAALLPDAQIRQRIALVRAKRALWPQERAWAQALGFADVYAYVDSAGLVAQSRGLLDWVAKHTGVPAVEPKALTRYFSAMQVKPDTTSARGLIRHATGLTAEALCEALARGAKEIDRNYRLRKYPRCFVGSDAVNWLSAQYAVPSQMAVKLGLALQELGLLHHVAHEHAFADEAFFYRTGLSAAADALDPARIFHSLSARTGVVVKDRTYLGKTYPTCFVGSEAVDWLSNAQKISRLDAEIMLNRLNACGFIEHVTHEHPVRDGLFYYRFSAA
jgi:Domain found in Dishevelled, Egl-10, and Pleckstrin (DEP)